MARNTGKKNAEDIRENAKVRIEKYLHDGGVFRASDEELVNLYADTFAFYQRMKSELDGKTLLMSYTNKAGATNLVKNPLAIEITKTAQVLNNLLRSLGLTPAQRKEFVDSGFVAAKDGEGDEPERDDFDNF